MNFYHIAPPEMRGEVLLPLADLEADLRAWALAKYEDHPGRKGLPDKIIPILNCARKHVVHFLPMHPHLVYSAYREIFPQAGRPLRFWEIPVARLESPAVIFDMNRTGEYDFAAPEKPEHYELVTTVSYRELPLPTEASEFFKQWKARGENGAPLFGRVPHLFVQGPVSVAGCRQVDWSEG